MKKAYVDMTNNELKRECAKIFEALIGLHVTFKQIILLEADEDRVYFECANITIDHREYDKVLNFVRILSAGVTDVEL